MGKPGWVSIAALGVAIVVGGNYVAWNFGIAAGGWPGMLVAVMLSALLYLALASCIAELSSMFQSEAAAVEFVRQGFGPALAAVAGWCVLSEFIAAGSALAAFFGAYGQSVSGLATTTLVVALFVAALGLQLLGAREVLWVTQCMTVVAVGGVLITTLFLLGTVAERPYHPLGSAGMNGVAIGQIWAAIPYAVVLFLGIEAIAVTAEEVDKPARTIPRALLSAVGIQCLLVVSLLWIVPATVDLRELTRVDDPIAFAWQSMGAQGVRGVLAKLCTGCALVATATSFFSVMFAYSRQVHAFAREGFLPRGFTTLNGRNVPVIALVVPTTVALLLALYCRAELLVVLCVFGATASYVLIFGAHLRLRRVAPERLRSYRAPGEWVSLSGLVLTTITFLACMRNEGFAAGVTGGVILLLSAYSVWWCRLGSPERAAGSEIL